MTFSILARDPDTGAIGGAAATGSLCVGGWVLRGDLRAGMSASQGASPSTFWGEDVLIEMRRGTGATQAVKQITSADSGRDYRQLTALDLSGQTGAFTGDLNEPGKGSLVFGNGIVSGNMLANINVLDAMALSFEQSDKPFDQRLLNTLHAAVKEGGDYRGLLSAALLVLHPNNPPLTLRIDYHPNDPVTALIELHKKATTGDYANWAKQVPILNDKERTLD
ncbi:DUF1028 domain-containing protein [Kiloniella litopenaei]|uniref:DUF1028 domain-containing protein n=1 Tax=Kiloniella litopenaei TaxID=1549748 RepID=UPI003BAA1F1C